MKVFKGVFSRIVGLAGFMLVGLGTNDALASVDHPYIYRLGGESRLHLTVEMDKALKQTFTDFAPWRERDYMLLVRRDYKISWRQAPFAAVGDFNGDGRGDAAIQGHTAKEQLTVVLLSRTGENAPYQVHVIERGPTVDPAKLDYHWPDEPKAGIGLLAYLDYAKPGHYDVGFEQKPLNLRHEAFEEVYWGKSSIIRYWTGKDFGTYFTSD